MNPLHGITIEEVNDAQSVVNEIMTGLGLRPDAEQAVRDSLLRAVVAVKRVEKGVKRV